MGWSPYRGFAVVFAEDVPEVLSKDIETGRLECILEYACDGSPKRVLLHRRVGATLSGV